MVFPWKLRGSWNTFNLQECLKGQNKQIYSHFYCVVLKIFLAKFLRLNFYYQPKLKCGRKFETPPFPELNI